MDIQTLQLPVELPAGPDCDRCIARLQEEVGRIKGVVSAAVNNARTHLRIQYDPNLVTLSRIEREARGIGADIAARIDHLTLELRDLDCPDCAARIESDVQRLPGVLWAAANFAAGQMHVEFERGKLELKDIRRIAEGHGVRACPLAPLPEDARSEPTAEVSPPLQRWWEERRKQIVTVSTSLLTVLAAACGASGQAQAATLLYALAIATGGWSIARSALLSIRGRALDMNVLMTLAVLGAAALGDWFEGATVVALFSIGNLLQAGAMERTRRSIRALMDLTPRTARVRRGGEEIEVPVEQVRLKEIVLVRPGERIPMDGVITAGASPINEAPITGESVPVDKGPGDRVFAGTLNGPGAIELEVTSLFRDTVLSRIIHRVEEAQAQRAPAQQFIDRFARIYTPVVVGIAVAVALLPPLALWGWHFWHGGGFLPGALSGVWSEWFLRALSLLIIACPCALVISTPVAIVTAIGSASRNGALVKGGAFLEEIGRVRAIFYDKTGTLTTGRFRVEDVIPLAHLSCSEILQIAGAVEVRSEHPLATAFVEVEAERGWRASAAIRQASIAERAQRSGAQEPLPPTIMPPSAPPDVTDFQALPGLGARATVKGKTYLVGNAALLERHQVALDGARPYLERGESLGKTAVLLADTERPLGVVILSDTPRTELAKTVRELESLGIERQMMLTGDNAHVARGVAEAVGLQEFKANLLPEQKLALVKEYQRTHGSVGMVGDGINDAPALAAANVGIVMGAAGSDTAIETADIALMGDDLTRLPFLIRLSRRTRAIIRQNVAFSLGTKLLLLLAAMFVGIPLWLAVLGDVGVSLLVTLNALRLVRV